jgi:hypothetical protein
VKYPVCGFQNKENRSGSDRHARGGTGDAAHFMTMARRGLGTRHRSSEYSTHSTSSGKPGGGGRCTLWLRNVEALSLREGPIKEWLTPIATELRPTAAQCSTRSIVRPRIDVYFDVTSGHVATT